MMHKVLNEVLSGFIARDGMVAAALFGTDGLVIESASHKDIDMDRIGALFGIYFANTANQSQGIRIIPLPKQEQANYVLLATVSGALLALFTNNVSGETTAQEFEQDIRKIERVLSPDTPS